MNYIIRKINRDEINLLEDFLYEAIFIPSWYKGELPRDIIFTNPKLYNAIKNFGSKSDDYCLVTEVDGKIVGAVWTSIADEYGHIDDETPSLSISLYKEYRNHGIGSEMLRVILQHLKSAGYKQISLSVNKENLHAVHVYKKIGFKIIDGGDETEFIMIYNFAKKNFEVDSLKNK